ncbi:hypothetical protein JL720_9441 [Aureococcus anophagefferens]|nr:hypothetical protein JL720_9441 [Aureococcus anophagefferens]
MIVSGSSHLIIPKKILAVSLLALLGGFTGVLVSNHVYSRRVETFLHQKTKSVAKSNKQLEGEQEDYRALFNKLTWQLDQDEGKGTDRDLSKDQNLFKQMSSQLDDWKAAHDLSLEAQKTRITSFKESSEALMLGLDDVRTVLEEKEFQLWEKEGLLEYQEERLLDSEDQEVQMALYINMLAQSMLALNLTLPEGLEEQPYYGQERAHTDDAPNDDAIRRRRRLRAKAPLPAGVTGAYRAHLLAQGRKGRAA